MTVNRLATASEQASLVRLGLSSGLLARCAEPVAVADLANAVDAPEASVAAVCTAFVALGALRREGTEVRLTEAWAPLMQSGLDVTIARGLDAAALLQRLIQGALSKSPTYWELDSAERRIAAEAVSFQSTTEFGLAAVRNRVNGLPGLGEALRSGARWLELGCGVAGMLLGVLQHYPDLYAVGTEIDPDLLSVAQARARKLGVGDRVRFIECDATAYTEDEPFDVVFWSQHFFPRASRRAALENAFARLRTGGLLLCPVMLADYELLETGSLQAQQVSINAIFSTQWDVPVLACDDLAEEITEVGFVDVHAYRDIFPITMMARRP
jgi:predicted O-methyltransferase YrrM